MLRSAQIRADLSRKSWSMPGFWAVLCEISPVDARAAQNRATLLRTCLGPDRSAPDLPRKPCSVLGFSAIVDARVRAARLRFSRENRAWFLSSMLGSAQVRAGFVEKTLLRAVW